MEGTSSRVTNVRYLKISDNKLVSLSFYFYFTSNKLYAEVERITCPVHTRALPSLSVLLVPNPLVTFSVYRSGK